MNTPTSQVHNKGKTASIIQEFLHQAHPAELSILPHPPCGIMGVNRAKLGGVWGIY